jgi:hypothetical protein
MATFYNDIKNGEVDVVFVANNMKSTQRLTSSPKSNESLRRDFFPKINRFWFYPQKAFPYDPTIWKFLATDKRLRGTGVTPKLFEYKNDWNECGKTDVFNYYGVQRELHTIRRWPAGSRNATIVIQPFGGADDPTKVKQLSKVLLNQLVNKRFKNYSIIFIGSTSDIEEMQAIDWDTRSDRAEIRYCIDIKEAVNHIRGCSRFIGTDSWGKSCAALTGLKPSFIEVYKNKYTNRTPHEMFGQDTDPGDFVFLRNWGFSILDDPEII